MSSPSERIAVRLPDGTTQACYSEVQVSYVKQGAAAGVNANGMVTTFGAAAQAALEQP